MVGRGPGGGGLATAVAAGTTIITATLSGKSGTAALTVTGATRTATIRLAWDRVTTNADTTPCDDLAGYKIYYGTASQQYGTPINVVLANLSDPLAPTYDLTGLTAGTTYYIAATAYDTSWNESVKSTEVSGAAK